MGCDQGYSRQYSYASFRREQARTATKLNRVGCRFLAEQRIRVCFISPDCPNSDLNHDTGKPYHSDGELRVVNQTLHHTREMASHIILPIIP